MLHLGVLNFAKFIKVIILMDDGLSVFHGFHSRNSRGQFVRTADDSRDEDPLTVDDFPRMWGFSRGSWNINGERFFYTEGSFLLKRINFGLIRFSRIIVNLLSRTSYINFVALQGRVLSIMVETLKDFVRTQGNSLVRL